MSVALAGPYVLEPEEGDDLWLLGGLYTFKALGSGTRDAYTACEVAGPQGLAVPMHSHDGEEEGFYVASGVASIWIGDEKRELSAGAFAFVPRGIQHTFRLDSSDARLLLLISPGAHGHEQMFREMGEPADSHVLPPGPAAPPDAAALGAIAARHGTRIVGPPPTGDD
jgi:quercetin dioxygenase-like cupin family protein